MDKVEANLLDISNAFMTPDDRKTISLDFLKRINEGIGIIRLIRSQYDLFSLGQWKERKKGVDYLVPNYVIVDKKDVERFRVFTKYHSAESMWLTEIRNSYNCTRVAIRKDLISRNINKNNLFIY